MRKSSMPYLIILLAAAVLAVSGCGKQTGNSAQESVLTQNTQTAAEPFSQTSFKLDTVVTVTLYDSQDQDILTHCIDLCDEYEKIFSRTKEDSELYRLNHRLLPTMKGTADTYEISQPLSELLSAALSYSTETDGAFDAAIAPLSSLWDFHDEEPSVPPADDIQAVVEKCGYEGVTVQGQTVTLPSPDTEFDLGAIAKGYIADRMKEYLLSQGIKSAVISLGGNVLCVGEKPSGDSFKIGIQKPFADRNETIAIMEIKDKSIVSSGIYERYFEQDGKLYHHILNPRTGYPYDNGLVSVTIICDKSVDGDALSTSCFALGLEKGLEYLQSLDNVQGVFITSDYELHYTEDFSENIRMIPTDTGSASPSTGSK